MATNEESLAKFHDAGTLCPKCNKLSKKSVKQIETATNTKMTKNVQVVCVCP